VGGDSAERGAPTNAMVKGKGPKEKILGKKRGGGEREKREILTKVLAIKKADKGAAKKRESWGEYV